MIIVKPYAQTLPNKKCNLAKNLACMLFKALSNEHKLLKSSFVVNFTGLKGFSSI